MLQILAYWFSLVCSGVDFWKDPPDKSDNCNLDHWSMHGWTSEDEVGHVSKHDAWARVKKHPFSFFHHWVNFATSYMETPAQEPVAKLTGAIMLVYGFAMFGLGALVAWLMS